MQCMPTLTPSQPPQCRQILHWDGTYVFVCVLSFTTSALGPAKDLGSMIVIGLGAPFVQKLPASRWTM